MYNDVTHPDRRLKSHSNPRWWPNVLVVGKLVKVRVLRLDPKSKDQTVVMVLQAAF